MGTNYYIKDFEDPDDDPPGWHIGKQSAGHPWVWADAPLHALIIDDWLSFANQHQDLTVVDEYGRDQGRLADFIMSRIGSVSHNPGKGWC